MLTRQASKSDEQVIEVWLAADGNETILVWEARGMPPDLLAAYGAGVQVHVEDLAVRASSHSAGRQTGARRGEDCTVWLEQAT